MEEPRVDIGPDSAPEGAKGRRNVKNYLRQIPGLRAQVYATFAVCVASFAAGTASAWPGPMILVLTSPRSPVGMMTGYETSWVVTSMHLASIVTLTIGGLAVDCKGRRWGSLGIGMLPPIGWIVLATTRNKNVLYVGVSLMGSTVVCTLTIGVMFLSEIIHDKIRGPAITLQMFSFSFGELLTHVLGEYLSYTTYHIICFGIAFFPPLLMNRLPETPQYYVLTCREEEARKSVEWYHGSDPGVVEEEMSKLANSRRQSACNPELFSGGNLRALTITFFLFIWGELVGTTIIETYSGVFLKYASNPIFAGQATVILAIFRFVAGLISCYFVEKTGRRKLIIWSLVVMMFSLGLVSTFIAFKPYGFDSQLMFTTLVGLIVYTTANEIFVATAEVLTGEVVSPESKGWVLSLGGCLRVLTIIFTLQLYDHLLKLATPANFVFSGVWSGIGLIISIRIIPETKGKSLTDIRESIHFNFLHKKYNWKVEHV